MLGRWQKLRNNAEEICNVFLICSLVLSSLFLAWLLRPRACLDNSWFEELSLSLKGREVVITSCRSSRSLAYDEWINLNLPTLEHRLLRLEQVAVSIGITPVVLPDFQLQESELPHLEKRLLERSMADKPSPLETRVFVSSFLRQYLHGERTFVSSISQSSIGFQEALWSQVALDLSSSLSIWERSRFFREWSNAVKQGQAPLTKSGNWSWKEKVEQRLKIIGFDTSQNVLNLNFLFLSESGFQDDERSIFEKYHIASLEAGRLRLPRLSVSASPSEVGKIRVGKVLLVRCQMPTLRELVLPGISFEHVVIVNSCEPVSALAASQALRNPEFFARAYPDYSFVHLHWPSLQFALTKSGVKIGSVEHLFSPFVLARFEKSGIFKAFRVDKDTGVRYWQGAYDPIPAARWPHSQTSTAPRKEL